MNFDEINTSQIELIQTYEEFINKTREEFEQTLAQSPDLSIDDILRYSEHIHLRLDYYK